MPRIAVTGSVAFDTIMTFAGRFGDHILPEQTHRINVAFEVRELERRRGGTAANVSYTLALLGERPLLCAAVGGGDFDAYRRSLEAAGVDTLGALVCEDVTTAAAFITTDSAGNQITAFHSGAMSRAAGVDLAALADISEVVVGADDAGAMALHCQQAARLHARLVFAPAQQIPALPDAALRAGLEGAWLVVANEYELELIRERTGLDVEALRQRAIVARTRGGEGSELHTRDGVVTVPVAPIQTMADPTGAGDAYLAGLLAGLRAGGSLDVAGRMGAVAAAYVVEQQGPQTHRFSRSEFAERYRAAFGGDPALPTAA